MLASSSSQPGALPSPHTSLVGRDREIESLCALLRDPTVRLLTLTGPGGVGKTRLAIALAERVAERFADGVQFVSLAAVTDPSLVALTINSALVIPESGGRSSLEVLVDALAGRQMLLVLDNFEQVVDGAPVVTEMIGFCRELTVLVTSRAPLRISFEQEAPVAPLTLPDCTTLVSIEVASAVPALALFVERSRARRPGFDLTSDNLRAVAEICRRLDGLPLAIELAAARVKVLNPDALLDRLERPLALLTSGPRDQPERQQTMRTTIDWSYALLSPHEQKIFRQLSVFRGGWTLEAAEAVVDPDLELSIDVLDGLSSLLDKSLVIKREQSDGDLRFNMLEIVREYAYERLELEDEPVTVYQRYARHYLDLAEEQHPWHTGQVKLIHLRRLDTELSNLRAALNWAMRTEPITALRLVCALWDFWWVRGYLSEGRQWLLSALDGNQVAPIAMQAWALTGVGTIVADQGDLDFANILLKSGLRLQRNADDYLGIAWTLRRIASIAHLQGDYSTAETLNQESLAIGRAHHDAWLMSPALGNLSVLALTRGDLQRAAILGDEAVQLGRVIEDTGGLAIQLTVLASVTVQQGNLEHSRQLLSESLALADQVGAPSIVVACLAGYAAIAAVEGKMRRAARLFGAREELRKTIGELTAGSQNPMFMHHAVAAQRRLGTASWRCFFAEGQSMSLNDAINYAQRDSNDEPSPTLESHPRLSPREVDVLRLIARGHTDKEVADVLYVSPRTVSTHLTSIYAKLDVSTRTAAAAWAIRHGIAAEE